MNSRHGSIWQHRPSARATTTPATPWRLCVLERSCLPPHPRIPCKSPFFDTLSPSTLQRNPTSRPCQSRQRPRTHGDPLCLEPAHRSVSPPMARLPGFSHLGAPAPRAVRCRAANSLDSSHGDTETQRRLASDASGVGWDERSESQHSLDCECANAGVRSSSQPTPPWLRERIHARPDGALVCVCLMGACRAWEIVASRVGIGDGCRVACDGPTPPEDSSQGCGRLICLRSLQQSRPQ
jgi:hypothetical protein